MSDLFRGVTYLFILAIFLVALAYWAGLNQLGKTTFAGLNQLGLTFTGRDSSGRFANYPSGGPGA